MTALEKIWERIARDGLASANLRGVFPYGEKGKKKKEQVYFCLDKRYKSRFSHSPLRCSRPKRGRFPQRRGGWGVQPPLTRRLRASPLPRSSRKDSSFPQGLSRRGTAVTGPGPGRPEAPVPDNDSPSRRRGTAARHGTAPPYQAHPPQENGRRQPPAHRAPPYPRRLSPPPPARRSLPVPQRRPVIVAAGEGQPRQPLPPPPLPPAPPRFRFHFRRRPGAGAGTPRPAAILRAVRGGAFLPTS